MAGKEIHLARSAKHARHCAGIIFSGFNLPAFGVIDENLNYEAFVAQKRDNLTSRGNKMQLATINELKMTSLEIAELTGKQHKHVLRDVRVMLEELGLDGSKFGLTHLDGQNRQHVEYQLDHDLTITLITGYSAVLRHKVIKRWRELEEKVVKLEEMNQRLTNEDELGRLRHEVAR